MSRREGDASGVAAATGVGVLLGVLLLAPALPTGSVTVAGISLGTVGAALLAGALAVLVVPLGTLALYQLFFLVDR